MDNPVLVAGLVAFGIVVLGALVVLVHTRDEDD